jgi:hypothetical protein
VFQKYEIYVDTVLNASDEILEISPTGGLENLAAHSALAASRLFAITHFKQSGYLNQRKPTLVPARDSERTVVASTHARSRL